MELLDNGFTSQKQFTNSNALARYSPVMHYIKGNVLTVYWQLVALVRHTIAFQGRIAMYSQYINTVLNFVYQCIVRYTVVHCKIGFSWAGSEYGLGMQASSNWQLDSSQLNHFSLFYTLKCLLFQFLISLPCKAVLQIPHLKSYGHSLDLIVQCLNINGNWEKYTG